MEGEQQRFSAPAHVDGFVEQRKKCGAGFAFGQIRRRLSVLPGNLTYPPVDVWTVRLQQIISETERIAAMPVVHTERGNQSGCDQAARHGSPNDSIAVVQECIHTLGLAVAAERLAEQAWPVSLRGLSFKIVRIARANPASHRSEPP